MRIRRGPLFWGIVLVLLGAIPLLARSGALDPALFREAWRLWPLILVGIGIALVLGRGHAGLLGTLAAALVIGIAGGGALASGNPWFGFTSCADRGAASQVAQANGSFDSLATVVVDVGCGSVDLSSGPGSEWHVDARYADEPPTIETTANSLTVNDDGSDGRQDWTISVPASLVGAIELQANATSATIRLPGASLASLKADANAADLLLDASEGRIALLDLSLNAGRGRITLGQGPTSGTIDANAGAIDLCVPAAATLRLSLNDQLTFAHNLGSRGLTQAGTTWTRPGSGGDSIDLSIEGNAASLTLDPDGGCR
jgi:hypothetical protein